MARYVKKNPGVPLIILFQLLLLICITLMNINKSLAEVVAPYSFYSLLLGVVFQLISFYSNGENGEKNEFQESY